MNKDVYIQGLGEDVITLVEDYKNMLKPYEIGHQLISLAVDMMLSTAPSNLVAIKTILACVECGIASYEENHP